MVKAIEEPHYVVERQYGTFEIRDYPPYLVAEVVVPGPADAAGNRGFRILADYIFGKNGTEQKIPMTAPVAQIPTGLKSGSTLSQMQSPQGDEYIVQFAMPARYTLESLPKPLNPQVKLKRLEGGRYAVVRYSGTWSVQNYQRHLDQLEREVAKASLRTTGAPIYSRYNPPFMPWFLRRNEIWLALAQN